MIRVTSVPTALSDRHYKPGEKPGGALTAPKVAPSRDQSRPTATRDEPIAAAAAVDTKKAVKGEPQRRPERVDETVRRSFIAGAFDPGPQPDMQWLPVARLTIDHRYQRPLADAHAKRLAKNFRWAHFQPLTVTPAALADGSKGWAVIDGQHRLEAALKWPQVTDVPCYIVPTADLEAQAAAFLAVNTNHRVVTAVDRFRAALISRDPETMAIDRALKAAGVTVVPYGRTAMTTSSVSALRRAYQRSGEQALRRALKLIATAWPDDPDAFSEAFVSALPRLLRDSKPTDEAILAELARIKPREFWSEMVSKGRAEYRSGAAMVLSELTGRVTRRMKRS